MKLHENKELFKNAILATSQYIGIKEIYVEKDYWVTYALQAIFQSEMGSQAVFKGGTALSKCYKLIERFSEDIDIVVFRKGEENDNQLKRKIRKISKTVASILPEISIENLTNKKGNIRKTVHEYAKLYQSTFGQVREQIVLEVSWLGNFEPFNEMKIESLVAQMMEEKGQEELVKKYNLEPFNAKVLCLKRTFCEKIMSLARFSYDSNPYKALGDKIRHLYDIHRILNHVEITDFFEGDNFEKMMFKVGEDDIFSFKNNNEWLKNHPAKALLFNQPEKTWEEIRPVYNSTFKDLVYGKLPAEKEILKTLLAVSKRLETIVWPLSESKIGI